MPKRTTAPKATKKSASKPALKKRSPALSPKAAKKAHSAKLASPPPGHKMGFMWKLLEQKQAALKANEGQPKHPFAHADQKGDANGAPSQKGFARFAGPRRKAA